MSATLSRAAWPDAIGRTLPEAGEARKNYRQLLIKIWTKFSTAILIKVIRGGVGGSPELAGTRIGET